MACGCCSVAENAFNGTVTNDYVDAIIVIIKMILEKLNEQ
jgi:hypothetical protein